MIMTVTTPRYQLAVCISCRTILNDDEVDAHCPSRAFARRSEDFYAARRRYRPSSPEGRPGMSSVAAATPGRLRGRKPVPDGYSQPEEHEEVLLRLLGTMG